MFSGGNRIEFIPLNSFKVNAKYEHNPCHGDERQKYDFASINCLQLKS